MDCQHRSIEIIKYKPFKAKCNVCNKELSLKEVKEVLGLALEKRLRKEGKVRVIFYSFPPSASLCPTS